MGKKSQEEPITISLPELDVEEFKDLLMGAGKKAHHASSNMASKIEKLAEHIEEMVEEEMKEFFADME
jgi:hypothetical protein